MRYASGFAPRKSGNSRHAYSFLDFNSHLPGPMKPFASKNKGQSGTVPQLPGRYALSAAKSYKRHRISNSFVPERRRAVRYCLKLALEFAAKTDSQVWKGRGLTTEISHAAVRFTCD